MSNHQCKIVPAEDRGFWLVSNNRAWFVDFEMLHDIAEGAASVLATGQEWRNYEEPIRVAIPAKPGLKSAADLLADIGLT